MKKVLLAMALVAAAPLALADSYTATQHVVAPEFAINVASTSVVLTDITQVAQNVGNVASIKDLDGWGGDHFTTLQTVNSMQFAKNTLNGSAFGKIDQSAINFGSDLTIKDSGGPGSIYGGAQTVVAEQYQSGMQHSINQLTTVGAAEITQTAANVANTMDIDLPSTVSLNSVNTTQIVSAPQVAGNFATVSFGVGTFTQVAANAGNQVSITQ